MGVLAKLAIQKAVQSETGIYTRKEKVSFHGTQEYVMGAIELFTAFVRHNLPARQAPQGKNRNVNQVVNQMANQKGNRKKKKAKDKRAI